MLIDCTRKQIKDKYASVAVVNWHHAGDAYIASLVSTVLFV